METLPILLEKLANNKEIILKLKVFPGASQNLIKGEMVDGWLKIDISAPPEDGKANLELVKFLAKTFKIKKYQIELINGQADRRKTVRLWI